LFNLGVNNVKGGFLIVELITMFPLPVELFGCKDVCEGLNIHAIVMVECQNLNMLENIFNYLSEIALSEIVEDEIEVVHFKLRYFL
jgi:hypothetical protein